MVEYIQLKASELAEYSKGLSTTQSEQIAITPWRAESQLRNPALKDDDTLLLLAKEDDKLLAYLGMLPETSDGPFKDRVYWVSCWWSAKGTSFIIPLTLFSKYLKLSAGRVLFSDLSETTRSIVQKAGAFKSQERKGIQLRIRSGYEQRLHSKDLNFLLQIAKKSGIFRMIDSLQNGFRSAGLKKFTRTLQCRLEVSYTEQMEEEHEQFIRNHAAASVRIPGTEFFNWVKENPWLAKPVETNKKLARKYYFSALAVENELQLMEFRLEGSIKGLAILRKRDGVLKTNYLYWEEAFEEEFFAGLTNSIIGDKSIHTLITFEASFLAFLQKKKPPAIQSCDLLRYTAISSLLAEELNGEYTFHDGDGDYIFT